MWCVLVFEMLVVDPIQAEKKFAFPRWANYLLPLSVLGVLGGGLYVSVLMAFGLSPKTTDVGYMPEQPVPFSHAMHAGQLGMDCRYCHGTVERASFAALPSAQTCMNCHTSIKPQSTALVPIRESWKNGDPVEWIKVHDLPDHAYFNHSAHVNHGVGCVSCHGRIDQMDLVRQTQPLSMAWCLGCHREPEKYLRPQDEITNMSWKPKGDGVQLGLALKKNLEVQSSAYMTSCSTCHR